MFALGYVDRIVGGEQVVPLTSVSFDPQRPGMFRVEAEGAGRATFRCAARTLVYKDGVVIWQRPDPPAHA